MDRSANLLPLPATSLASKVVQDALATIAVVPN
jgi:hypothetical protein